MEPDLSGKTATCPAAAYFAWHLSGKKRVYDDTFARDRVITYNPVTCRFPLFGKY
jgi:hypothetical protein